MDTRSRFRDGVLSRRSSSVLRPLPLFSLCSNSVYEKGRGVDLSTFPLLGLLFSQ